ncbi:PREDICTED: NAD-dependent protein deacetylase sirtuin-6-like [Amphimedon queenslandica]|uniref:protein acetyllysine N-acetyltransferase n=1 Tax=Amphimedon queenslandica TaxID=400682 RepID=A0A1X7V631_AMPQE|nr:PREDICTED: NAD-dependent protein deacetylase sirtuin-6-like [Amphimedon queenslandica]|eukprot:XP_003385596.1 PREDICTED: NAD-dependent protein deacetylase sirtuin-6-like [Amphimedon queenslandica]
MAAAFSSSASKKRSKSSDGCRKKAVDPGGLFCSLLSCSRPPFGEDDNRVEVVSLPYQSRTINWGEKGDGVFHKDCWEEILRNARLRNPKRATMKLEPSEKAKIKEAAKTVEYFDSVTSLKHKASMIVHLIMFSKHCVTFTGAGISTSAGIGDYRGKRGKWTKEDRKEEEEEEEGVPYEQLRPTYTHESLVKLMELGHLKYVITQNGDGLHSLSGIPPDKLAELHGNVFEEFCESCDTKYARPYYVLDDDCSQYYEDINDCGKSSIKKPTYGSQCPQCSLSHRTGRKCVKCPGQLKDSIINFGDDLREDVLTAATREARKCDLLLSLGSSMTVTPASDLISMGKKPLSVVIINRQKTSFDDLCSSGCGVRVFGDTDDVMRLIMKELLKDEGRKKWEGGRDERMKFYDQQRSGPAAVT